MTSPPAVCESAPRFRDDAAVTVVCATEGYPHAPRSGDVIEGLDAARAIDRREHLLRRCRPGLGRRARHVGRAGPERDRPRPTRASSASSCAYQAVGCLAWPGMVVRSDIARAEP